MTTPEERLAEIRKYSGGPGILGAYNVKGYQMMEQRVELYRTVLKMTPFVERRSLLDVSCGRAESLLEARKLGHFWVRGTEAVDFLLDSPDKVKAILPDLPFGDKVFDTVTCFDVMEHIPRDDWRASIESMARVCKRRLVLCISNVEDTTGKIIGQELHITRLPYTEIDDLLKGWLWWFDVRWLKDLGTEDAQVWDCVVE